MFFDEITNATPAIQGMAYNIILDKVVNGKWKLPDNVKVVAAGNEDKESLSANKISEPLFRRFNHLYIETTLESWLLWASKHNIHPAIYAFVASKGDGREQVLRTECNGKDPCVDPRKWEMASKLLYKCRNPRALTATIGERLTEEFIRFCKMPVITLDQVIHGEYDENMPRLSIDEGYATLIGQSVVKDKHDLELIMLSAKYHDIGRKTDAYEEHAESSAQIAVEKLRDKCSAEDLSIISTIIQFHEIPRNISNVDAVFLDIARKNGIPDEQISRAREMAEVLKDADALDRTRFINKARLNPEFLQYGISRQLIRFASSLQETYAIQDLKEFQCDEAIGRLLQNYTPQEVLRTIRHSTRANLRMEDIQSFINSWAYSSTKKTEEQELATSTDGDISKE